MADDFDFDLGDGDFLSEGMPGLDPAPDDDAWEAFLNLAIERIDGDPERGLRNSQLAELESALGAQLPFEVGMFLVMGTPSDGGWWRWESPADDIAEWNGSVLAGIHQRIGADDLWLPSWGPKPDARQDQLNIATEAFTAAPQLLPIYDEYCVSVTVADGETSSDSNPIWRVAEGAIALAGTDLASWLNRVWEVPLPMWPETPARTFPFWSELQQT